MRSIRTSVAVTATLLMTSGMLAATSAVTSAAPAGQLSSGQQPAQQCEPDPGVPKHQLRAMWISSVFNIDWPSSSGLSAAAQQAEFRSWLDLAEDLEMNAVIVQIRPTADALWPSPYEPWSQWLTGTQGSSPGYDPLGFMVAEAHSRDIEFHAWFNPYRVATHANPNLLVASHPVRQNPGWAFSYNGQLYYNPGIPAVRNFVIDAMMDAVTRYDIDGVHWDDYFYPYPAAGQQIPDQATYNQHGGGFASIHDWRRNNVDLLVEQMSQRIAAEKPHVAFGVSPFGIWRNASTDPLGSATSGLQSYDAIYADSRKWVLEGWLDYITPQIYWEIGHGAADYAALVPWWSDVVSGTGVQLSIGQAAYKISTGGAWNDPAELSRHLTLNREHPEVVGDVYFSAGTVSADPLGAISRVASDHYTRPALLPPRPALGGGPPPAPSIADATRAAGGVSLTITGAGTSYAVYRVDGSGPADPCEFADASRLLGTVRASGQATTFLDTTAGTGEYSYYATALSRSREESGLSGAAVVTPGTGGPWSVTIDNSTLGGFTASGNWGTSSWSPERFGSDYRYAEPVSASDVAWYRADIPAAGNYRVEVWYPSNAGYNSSTPYLVAASGGTEVVRVDQRTGGGRWVDIGTFALSAGSRDVVGVSRWTATSGYVVADAVRLTRQ